MRLKRILMAPKTYPECALNASWVRQMCPQGGSEVLPGCAKSAPGWAKSAPRVRQMCPQGAPKVLPGCAKSAPRVGQMCLERA